VRVLGPLTAGPRRPALRQSMADARSGEVIFVSHCLLNQNTRYPGGAVCPGVVDRAVRPYVESGVGLVQLPCPEQRVWGGVLKRRLGWLIEHPRAARAAPLLLPAVRTYLRWRYAHQARAVARDVQDYRSSGLGVRGVVGVAGSPTCGVHTTLALGVAAAALARRRPGDLPTATWMNAKVVAPARCPGRGIFVQALAEAFDRRGLDVPLLEQDLSP
jgi:uncharacterized protein YbbK (DUF523 family)